MRQRLRSGAWLRLHLAFFASFSLACAFARTVDYQSAVPKVTWQSKGSVALAVQDQRPEIVGNKRPPNWVGLSRGGYGIPYDVHTADKQPLSASFAHVLTRGLEKAGLSVIPVETTPFEPTPQLTRRMAGLSAPRNVVVTITTWKSDSNERTSLRYGFFAAVTDQQGRVLGKASEIGDEILDGDIGDAQSELPKIHRRAVSRLLNDVSFVRAMSNAASPEPATPGVAAATPGAPIAVPVTPSPAPAAAPAPRPAPALEARDRE